MGSENNNTGVPLKGCPEGFVKADLLARAIARIIDTLIFATLSSFFLVGLLAGLLYLLIADGLMDGRSLGKKIIGLKVVLDPEMTPISYKESIIRNAPMALLALFAVIPFIGWFFLVTVGTVVISLSIYLALTDERGRRAGDIMARTLVVPAKCTPVESNSEQTDSVVEEVETLAEIDQKTETATVAENETNEQEGGSHEEEH